MNKFKLFLFEFLLISTAILIVFFIYKNFNKTTAEYINPNENKNLENSNNLPDLIVQNFYLKQINQYDKNYWQINAKQGKLFKKENKIECQDIICKLLKKDQEIASIYSKFSVFNQNEKKLYLKNNIVCNFNKLSLTSQSAVINLNNHTINLEDNIKTVITK